MGHERSTVVRFSLVKEQLDRVEGRVSNDNDGDGDDGGDGGDEDETSEASEQE